MAYHYSNIVFNLAMRNFHECFLARAAVHELQVNVHMGWDIWDRVGLVSIGAVKRAFAVHIFNCIYSTNIQQHADFHIMQTRPITLCQD